MLAHRKEWSNPRRMEKHGKGIALDKVDVLVEKNSRSSTSLRILGFHRRRLRVDRMRFRQERICRRSGQPLAHGKRGLTCPFQAVERQPPAGGSKVKSNSSHLREKNEAPEDRNGRVPRKYGKRTAGKAIQPRQRPLAYACRGNIDRSRLPGDWLRLSPASAG